MPRRSAGPWVIWPGGSLSRVGRAEKRSSRKLPCPPWRWKECGSASKVRRPKSSSSRRFEILLPLRFNDGQPVPDELVADTLLELRQQFGAVSSETQVIRGIWEHQGQSYRDDLVRVFVDVADVPESRQFFVDFKGTLEKQVSAARHLGDDLPDRGPLSPLF